MKTHSAGELLYSSSQPSELLFVLKKGRVRIFRVSADGRALTAAIISPGTIFGETVLLGQRMYDNFAECPDDVTVCVMSRADSTASCYPTPRSPHAVDDVYLRCRSSCHVRSSNTRARTHSRCLERSSPTGVASIALDECPTPRAISCRVMHEAEPLPHSRKGGGHGRYVLPVQPESYPGFTRPMQALGQMLFPESEVPYRHRRETSTCRAARRLRLSQA